MSGFEVAGIVLGSIPIVVSALEFYMKGLGTLQNFRSYKRILKSLILALKTEHVNLQNICEKLLVGIAPQTRIEEMIRDPFGKLWKETEIFNRLRLRLWTSLQVFDERVHDMREAIEEMMEKLNCGPNSTVNNNTHFLSVFLQERTNMEETEKEEVSSIRKQFKRATFILQKSNHEEVLTRIRDGVSALQRLAVLNTDLESERKSRSQGRLNRLVNGMLNGMYHALQSAMACKCGSLHDVGLRLTPPSLTVVPEDDDEDIIRELQFRLAISHMKALATSFSRQWDEILLKSGEESKKSTVSVTTQTTISLKKSIGFAVPSSVNNTANSAQLTQTSVTLRPAIANLTLSTIRMIADTRHSRHIGNLCKAMQ
ncbi:hypothetical protein NW762_003987 [Fusarium torreyae]|uniref:Uncharacterized protein n=1 Tax=Fusarium torreyae TaxID=1237075 RepID=A0A9W8VKC2_9HYPO|nr:hypothetical protein NW762_003987 [Fusarium torreyae]